MNINRHNYEEFFLLYVDNELTAEQKKSVDQFIQENPDLAGELDLFRQTSLVSDDTIVFAGKEGLLKKDDSFITSDNYEEYLISYIDNELAPAESKAFEHFVNAHPSVQEELSIFRQAKLQPEKEIVFGDKEILYRKEEKVRVITMQWWKIAVAAAVILAIGITTFTVFTKNTTIPVDLANNRNGQNGTEKKTPAKINDDVKKDDIKKEKQTVPAIENNDAVAAAKTTKEKITPAPKVNEEKIQPKTAVPRTTISNDVIAKLKVPVKNNATPSSGKIIENKVTGNTVPGKKEMDAINNNLAVTNPPAKQNNNNTTVTNSSTQPSDNKETAQEGTTDIGAVFASNNEEGKNKKTRGFFRKATRIFERRTNISAADDDDKVLIGVLAVRLK